VMLADLERMIAESIAALQPTPLVGAKLDTLATTAVHSARTDSSLNPYASSSFNMNNGVHEPQEDEPTPMPLPIDSSILHFAGQPAPFAPLKQTRAPPSPQLPAAKRRKVAAVCATPITPQDVDMAAPEIIPTPTVAAIPEINNEAPVVDAFVTAPAVIDDSLFTPAQRTQLRRQVQLHLQLLHQTCWLSAILPPPPGRNITRTRKHDQQQIVGAQARMMIEEIVDAANVDQTSLRLECTAPASTEMLPTADDSECEDMDVSDSADSMSRSAGDRACPYSLTHLVELPPRALEAHYTCSTTFDSSVYACARLMGTRASHRLLH
jgi:hypothetical protein